MDYLLIGLTVTMTTFCALVALDIPLILRFLLGVLAMVPITVGVVVLLNNL